MVEDKFVEIRPAESIHLHVREWPGPGTPFVLVHGLASNANTWNDVAQQLNEAGHRVIAVDQRGHGLSSKPDSGYDFATVADDLALLLDQLALDNPILAGQSWGGNVMLAFGLRHSGRAQGLAFVDGGYIDLQLRADPRWESVAAELKPPSLIGIPWEDIYGRMRHFHPDWSDAGIRATLANFETLPDGTIRPWLTLERHMTILRALWEQRPATLYPLIREPVLIAVAADPKNPAWMAVKAQQVDAAQQALARAAIHWFPETDHDIHVHRPSELANLFLTTLEEGIWSEHGI